MNALARYLLVGWLGGLLVGLYLLWLSRVDWNKWGILLSLIGSVVASLILVFFVRGCYRTPYRGTQQ